MQNTQKNLAVIIGGYLSELRKDIGLTQQQIADNLHLSKSSISHFEQGIAIPTTLTLIALADYFDVNVDYILGRCKSNIKYSSMNETYYGQITVGDLLSRLINIDAVDRKFIVEALKMTEKAESKTSRKKKQIHKAYNSGVSLL